MLGTESAAYLIIKDSISDKMRALKKVAAYVARSHNPTNKEEDKSLMAWVAFSAVILEKTLKTKFDMSIC